MNSETDPKRTRCVLVAVVGAPNAGKSTLVNAMTGCKVSIVSPKAQTTRMPVRGIVMRGDTQIVLIDTPGLFHPQKRLERAMVGSAQRNRDDADIVLYIVDATTKGARFAAHRLKDANIKGRVALVLNKIDGLKRDKLLPLAQTLNAQYPFDATFMISALNKDGSEKILDWAAEHAPPGAWLYPSDHVSDLPLRLMAAEITREKLFSRLHDELPYALSVETESWDEGNSGVVIHQVIQIARDSQKGIVLGKGGSMIGFIGTAARQELEEILGKPVHLKLFVRVNERWADDPDYYRLWGLDFHA